MSTTTIEWTERTWNPIVGCSVQSPGCTNCYAMRFAGARLDGNPSAPHYAGLTQSTKAGPVWTGKVAMASDRTLTEPLRRRKPTMWFVNSMGDLFHPAVPDAWIARVFAVMALAPQHTFQVLTKQAKRMRAYCNDPGTPARVWLLTGMIAEHGKLRALAANGAAWGGQEPWPLRNVWLGVSVEDQRRAVERIPDLLTTPAAVRFVSAESLLGPVDFTDVDYVPFLDSLRKTPRDNPDDPNWPHMRYDALRGHLKGPDDIGLPKLDWIIVGGESGPGARLMHPDWARNIRDQCAEAGVPFFFKQWGEFSPHMIMPSGNVAPPMPVARFNDWRRWDAGGWRAARPGEPVSSFMDPGQIAIRVGKARAGRMLDGVEHNAMPEVR